MDDDDAVVGGRELRKMVLPVLLLLLPKALLLLPMK